MSKRALPPFPRSGAGLLVWAQQVHEFISDRGHAEAEVLPQAVLLRHQIASVLSRATVDGILEFDPVTQQILVSVSGVWEPLYTAATTRSLFVAAAYGSMRMAFNTAGADIGAAYSTLAEMDSLAVAPVNCSLTLPDTFSFDYAGVYQLAISGVFTHAEVNNGRTTYIRLLNVTKGAAGDGVAVGTGRNVGVTSFSQVLMLDLPVANVGDLYQVQIGGGDIYTTVVWDAQSVSLNYVSEFRSQV